MTFFHSIRATAFSVVLATGFAGSAHADACNAACTAAEVTAQTACVLAIFDEPECSIAVAAAYAACQAACAGAHGSSLTFLATDVKADLTTSSISGSGLCDGSVTVLDQAKADAFCSLFK